MSIPDARAAHLFTSIIFLIFLWSLSHLSSAVPPFSQLAVECLKYTEIIALTLIPPYLEIIGESPGTLEILSAKVDCIFLAEGDTSLATGNALAAGM